MRPCIRPSREGITLIEAIVAIAIMAVVAGLLIPAIQKTRESAARAETMNTLRQMGLAAHNCHTQFKRFPAFLIANGGTIVREWNGRTGPIHYFLLPFLDGNTLYNKEKNSVYIRKHVFQTFLSPMDPSCVDGKTRGGDGAANFIANHFAFPEEGARISSAHYPRGMSNCVFFGTAYANCENKQHTHAWGDTGTSGAPHTPKNVEPKLPDVPTSALGSKGRIQGFTEIGAIVCKGDASSRVVAPTISEETWKAVMKPRSMLLPGPDWDQ